MGVRRGEGRGGEDDVQLDRRDPPRPGPPVCARHLHRPRPQPQRRLPAALYQDPHSGQWLHQSFRHGEPYSDFIFLRSSLITVVLNRLFISKKKETY